MTKIITNRIQCKNCHDIIESHYRHDYALCSCRRVGVDGGKSYLKRIGRKDNYVELSEFLGNDGIPSTVPDEAINLGEELHELEQSNPVFETARNATDSYEDYLTLVIILLAKENKRIKEAR